MVSKIKNVFIGSIILLFFVFPTQTLAANYYVSPSGNDTNSGIISSPYKTITKALSIARAGDTIYLRQGTYKEQVALSQSGTNQARLMLTAYQNEIPVIDGSGVSLIYDALVQVRDNVNYVTVSGLTIKNSPNMGLANRGSHNLFENNIILLSYDTAIWHRIGTGNTFKNNHIYNNVLRNANSANETSITCLNTATWWPATLNSHKSHLTASLWENNYVHDNCGEGIVANSGDQIIGNTFKDNWSSNIYVDEASNTFVDRNLVYDTATTFIPRGNDGSYRNIGTGIAIADEAECLAHDNTIQNNIIINTRFGFSYYRYQTCSGLINVKFINNTIVNTWESSLRLLAGNHQNNHFTNNIIHARQGNLLLAENISGLIFENNLWYNQTNNQNSQFTWGQNNYSFSQWSALNSNIRNNQWGDPQFAGDPQSYQPESVRTDTKFGAINFIFSPRTFKLGDANGDDKVDGVDYIVWLNHYNQSVSGVTSGDFNNNGKVDGVDYIIWANGYGK